MLPERTPAVDRALEAARRWAIQLGLLEIQPLHLIGGLLEEEEGQAASLLAAAGLDIVAWRLAVGQASCLPDESAGKMPAPPFAPATLQALREARELAGSLSSDRGVSSECLLLPLIRAEEMLCRSLEEHGLGVARLEAALKVLAGPPLELDEPLQLVEVTERIDAARALDANANRAREALRVVEDYCRFCLDDALLSGELKRTRHDLTAILAELPGDFLLEARDTLRDVGTTLSTTAERERRSLREVAHANLKRLQEALRSLEEFGKLFGGETGARLEELRYRSYTLERAILLGAAARERLAGCTVQVLLTGALCSAALDWTLAEAAAGGAGMVQLREKDLGDRELLARARNVRRWTRQAGVLFIVNDRPDIARLVEADGVHLGQDDLPVKEARRIAGPDLLIGVSTHNMEQARRAVLDGASYLGVGPTFPSGTKEFSNLAGLEFVRQAASETSLPLFVIGGINARTLPAAVAAGARRIAVSQAVCQAEDPRAAVAELVRLLRP